jgi:hypothetical protein
LALSSLSSRQSSEISELVSRVSSLSAQVDLLSHELKRNSAAAETALQKAIASIDCKLNAAIEQQSGRTGRLEAELSELRNQQLLRFAPFPIVHESPFSPSRPMDGLIRHLATVSGGVSAMLSGQVIEVCASSMHSAPHCPAKLVDQDENSYFCSAGGIGHWICIDFKSKRVLPTYYTLMARNNDGANVHNLRSWVLEGSETGSDGSWREMDVESDRVELNGKGFRYTFPVKSPIACRFVRLRSIGAQHGGNALVLAGMELFGTLMQFK